MEVVGTRRRNRAALVLRSMPSGESILRMRTVVRRDRRALYNFGIVRPTKRTPLRRKARDGRKQLLRG